MFTQINIGFRSLAVLAMTLAISASVGSAPAAVAPATPVRPVAPAHTEAPKHALASLINPHLHGATPAVTKSVSKTAKKKVASHWVRRWSFEEWATLHRGTGTITGEVHTASGSPASGVRVSLKNSKGGTLRSPSARHVTHTTSSGHFVMHHVRIGSYRVRATKGKAGGHVPIKLHGGQLITAHVKI